MINNRSDSPKPSSPTGSFDWDRQSGPTGTGGTGPNSGQGPSSHYVYVEVSDPQRPGHYAR